MQYNIWVYYNILVNQNEIKLHRRVSVTSCTDWTLLETVCPDLTAAFSYRSCFPHEAPLISNESITSLQMPSDCSAVFTSLICFAATWTSRLPAPHSIVSHSLYIPVCFLCSPQDSLYYCAKALKPFWLYYLLFWRHVICLCQTFVMFWGFLFWTWV